MIIDICLILAIALFVFIGSRRGFIKEAVSLVGVVLSLLIAIGVAGIGSQALYKSVVRQPIYDTVNSVLTENVNAVLDESTVTVGDMVPAELVQMASKVGINFELDDSIDLEGGTAEVIDSATNSLVDNVVEPICTKALYILIFILSFVLSMILIALLAKALNIVAKLPVLHSLNRLFGAIVGGVRGAVIAIALCYGLYLVLLVFDNSVFGFNLSLFTGSKIMGIFIK